MNSVRSFFTSRRRTLQVLFGAPLGALVTGGVSTRGADAENPFTITSTVQRVVLDVSVRKHDGGYVTGLDKEHFRIFEDSRPQPILSFSSAETPVTVGLIVDNSGSMRSKRPSVVMAGLAFAKESNPNDEFFVLNFNDNVSPGLPAGTDFSDSLKMLHSALYMGEPAGQTALYDAVVYGLKHLQKGRQPKQTLIVVSDGGDNVSTTPVSAIRRYLRSSETTVYTIGLFTDEDPDRNPGILQKIAHLSGGEYFNPQSLNEVIPVFHKIAVDIRNRYTLSYAPDPHLDPVKHSDRSIRVTVEHREHKNLIVRTRTSYSLKAPDLLANS